MLQVRTIESQLRKMDGVSLVNFADGVMSRPQEEIDKLPVPIKNYLMEIRKSIKEIGNIATLQYLK